MRISMAGLITCLRIRRLCFALNLDWTRAWLCWDLVCLALALTLHSHDLLALAALFDSSVQNGECASGFKKRNVMLQMIRLREVSRPGTIGTTNCEIHKCNHKGRT